MTPADALAYLEALPRFATAGGAAYRPGLERMEQLLAAMGEPHRTVPTTLVAGTNGKGSTASLLAAALTAGGRRTGLHTSPHLWHLAERMRIDGVPAPPVWLAQSVARHRPLFDRVGPSFFEATVALSLLYFAERGAEEAVVEVGLGGRLDATNVIPARLALITQIGLDHTDLLGETHAAIAREKAGIVEPGRPVLTSATHPEAVAAIRAHAEVSGSPFHHIPSEVRVEIVEATLEHLRLDVETPARAYPSLAVGVGGPFLAENAALALRAAELRLGAAAEAAARRGFREVRRLGGLRGRFHVFGRDPLRIADVGHNPDAFQAVLAALPPRTGRRVAIVGMLRDKAVGTVLALLGRAGFEVFAAGLAGPRGLSAPELAAFVRASGARLIGSGTVPEGMRHFDRHAATDDLLLVAGSYQTVAALPPTLLE